jgi:hypothetical protein
VVAVAKVCHEANRAFCETLGDHSQQPWDAAEQWQRDSMIAGVRFAVEHPAAAPDDLHQAWMKKKLADGWVYGKVKDPEQKTHPCLVPYDQLPKEQQLKDSLFRAIVTVLLA